MNQARFILAALFACGIAAAEEPTRFEVYPLNGAEIESTAELVKTLAGPDGQVSLDPKHQRLLVVTTPDNHARIAEALRKLAVPDRNVLIEVQSDYADNARRAEVSISSSGEWSSGSGGLGGVIRIEPRIQNQTTARSGTSTQLLLIGSGREGALRVGEQVPHLTWIMDYGRRGGWVTAQWEWQEVGSFLVVQPTVLGNGPMIRVRVIPELRGRVEGRAEHIRFASLATEVVARDGETVSLGGLADRSEFTDRFLVGLTSDGRAERLDIRLTPRIQP